MVCGCNFNNYKAVKIGTPVQPLPLTFIFTVYCNTTTTTTTTNNNNNILFSQINITSDHDLGNNNVPFRDMRLQKSKKVKQHRSQQETTVAT